MRMPDDELKFFSDQPKALFAISKPNILEHAARRADLFFYTLVAYYNTSILPIQAKTDFQHGDGRNVAGIKTTAGCHSSFFAGFVDESMKEETFTRGRKKKIPQKSILSGTHFMDSLNATIELPVLVNHLDSIMEGKIGEGVSETRKAALKIIQRVSRGEIDPIQGLGEFLVLMRDDFKKLKDKKDRRRTPYLDDGNDTSPQEIRPKLLALIAASTLTGKLSTDQTSATTKYIELLLRLTPSEKHTCKQSEDNRSAIYAKKIYELQHEIHETPSHFIVPKEMADAKKTWDKVQNDVKKLRRQLLKAEQAEKQAHINFNITFKESITPLTEEMETLQLDEQDTVRPPPPSHALPPIPHLPDNTTRQTSNSSFFTLKKIIPEEKNNTAPPLPKRPPPLSCHLSNNIVTQTDNSSFLTPKKNHAGRHSPTS